MKNLDKVESEMAVDKKRDTEDAVETEALSRRSFIKWSATGLGVAAALPLFGGTADAARSLSAGSDGDLDAADASPSVEDQQDVALQAAADEAFGLLVAPIASGTKLGAMTVESVRVDRRGVGIVELKDERGRNYLAEVCRRTQRDANVRPLAVTKNYSVYLYNNASGSTPTDEKVGQAVVAVGSRVEANEKEVEVLALKSRKELWNSEGYLG